MDNNQPKGIKKKDVLSDREIRAEKLGALEYPKQFTPGSFAEWLKAYDPASLFLDPVRVLRRHKSLRMQMRRMKRLMEHPAFREVRDKHKQELHDLFWAALTNMVDKMLDSPKPNVNALQLLGELAGELQPKGQPQVNVNVNTDDKAREQFNRTFADTLQRDPNLAGVLEKLKNKDNN